MGTKVIYIPMKDRHATGQLRFPKLKDDVIELPTLKDMRKADVSLGYNPRNRKASTLSKSNKRLNETLGAISEFRQTRFNHSYKPILDTLGEDFPIHPEYLYVIQTVVKYYGVKFTDVLEYIAYKEQIEGEGLARSNKAASLAKRDFNIATAACTSLLTYVLCIQYAFNPLVVMQMFGMSLGQLRCATDNFCRQYQNVEAVRSDYAIIHGRLLKLQG